MFSFDEAQGHIGRLVEDFQNKISVVKSDKYKEANIEDEFIKPLFKYLNWNISNEGIKNIADREFIVQAKGKGGKEPDYLLQLEGTPYFYIEAKHPKYDLVKDLKYIWQAYSYAYSTQASSERKKVDFSLLTDFEEFRFFDCTFKADPKTVNNFTVIDWKSADYVDKFSDLWDLFEKENVRKGSLKSLYINEKQIKANRIPPDKAFLADLDDEKTGWRILLAKDIKKFNPSLSPDFITSVIQLLIDRFVFIKVLSDREIEDDFLTQIIEQIDKASIKTDEGIINDTCKDLFAKMDKTYNGSVFERRKELDTVTLSNKTLHSILKSLLPENSRYNFKVIPVEILGTIYEQFLGKVVLTTEKRASIEYKPEVRKAGGVYYTPNYIVDYIVNNTVGKSLNTCKTITDLMKIKICDPACGSGSFLLGAYDKLIAWTSDYYYHKVKEGKELSNKEKELFYQDNNGNIRLTAKIKRDILRSCIFGVDIDPQAVEVTKMSLSLKALEDTKHDELYNEVDLFHEAVLPDLSENIKCGNSLIASDFYDDKNLSLFSNDEIKKVNVFDWEKEFSEILSPSGFNCVIGNPPWGAEFNNNEKDYFKNVYNDYHVRTPESFNYFIGKMSKLINNGTVGIIIPSSFLNQHEFWKTRKQLVETKKIYRICNLGDGVFEKVTAPSCILIFGSKEIKSPALFLDYRKKERDQIPVFLKNENDGLDASLIGLDSESYILQVRSGGDIFQKCYKWPSLKEIAEDVATGVSSGLDKAYVYTKKEASKLKLEKDILKKLIIGGEIGRYWLQPTSGKVIIYITPEVKISNYPNIHEVLAPYKDQLKKRREAANGKIPWYSLNWPRRKKLFELPKILIRQTADHIMACFDSDGWYCLKSGIIIQLPDSCEVNYYYILGLMNSRLMNYLYNDLVGEQSRVFPEVKPVQLFKLPIRTIDFSISKDKDNHDLIVTLVEQILNSQNELLLKQETLDEHNYKVLKQKVEVIDKQIDKVIYELYNISPEEIAIIEKVNWN